MSQPVFTAPGGYEVQAIGVDGRTEYRVRRHGYGVSYQTPFMRKGRNPRNLTELATIVDPSSLTGRGFNVKSPQEVRALKIVCPLCRAGVGQPCLKQSSTNNYWDKHPTKHPHRVRIEKARDNAKDQGGGSW